MSANLIVRDMPAGRDEPNEVIAVVPVTVMNSCGIEPRSVVPAEASVPVPPVSAIQLVPLESGLVVLLSTRLSQKTPGVVLWITAPLG